MNDHPTAPETGILPPRILVADDNPVNRELALRMLQRLGHAAHVADTGSRALQLHLAAPYDLLLMDCDMPELDGLQASRLLRQQEGRQRRAAIIALTADDSERARENCLAAGMDDFLPKPLRPDALAQMLARWLPASAGDDNGCGDELASVRGIFGAHFPEIALLYLEDSPPRIYALRAAGAANDAASLARMAHMLGGSSMSIGATGLAALCRALELDARREIPPDWRQRLAAIEAEYARVALKLGAIIR